MGRTALRGETVFRGYLRRTISRRMHGLRRDGDSIQPSKSLPTYIICLVGCALPSPLWWKESSDCIGYIRLDPRVHKASHACNFLVRPRPLLTDKKLSQTLNEVSQTLRTLFYHALDGKTLGVGLDMVGFGQVLGVGLQLFSFAKQGRKIQE